MKPLFRISFSFSSCFPAVLLQIGKPLCQKFEQRVGEVLQRHMHLSISILLVQDYILIFIRQNMLYRAIFRSMFVNFLLIVLHFIALRFWDSRQMFVESYSHENQLFSQVERTAQSPSLAQSACFLNFCYFFFFFLQIMLENETGSSSVHKYGQVLWCLLPRFADLCGPLRRAPSQKSSSSQISQEHGANPFE